MIDDGRFDLLPTVAVAGACLVIAIALIFRPIQPRPLAGLPTLPSDARAERVEFKCRQFSPLGCKEWLVWARPGDFPLHPLEP